MKIAQRGRLVAGLCLFATLVCSLAIGAPGPAGFGKLAATDWPWWRGPTRNGVADDAPVPTQLDTQRASWKANVPGRGHSSPVVVGQRVILTTADEKQQIHSVLAFDRSTGKSLWQTEVSRGGFPARNHPKNTEASPTAACDGERLFVTFFHHKQIEVAALDLDGKILWKKVAGPFNPQKFEYGYAPSPLIYADTVIIAGEYDGDGFLVALDRKTGAEKWRTPRPNNLTFSSPVVAHVAGKEQLLISGAEKISSYNPATGKPLWSAPGTTHATCGTMIWNGDVVFASGGYPKPETIAIRADGSGKVLWKNNQKCYEQSMIEVAGHVYALTDNGVLFCWRNSDGQEMWKQRLAGPVSASPVLAGGNIYWANEAGTLYVFHPNPDRYEEVAENKVGDESFASPAACGGQIFLRVAHHTGNKRQEILYCFENK